MIDAMFELYSIKGDLLLEKESSIKLSFNRIHTLP
jgi:hypothetical protein